MVQDISLAVKVDKRQVKELGKLISGVEKQVGTLNKVKVTLDTTRAVKNLDDLSKAADKAKRLINAINKPGGLRAVKNSLSSISEASAAVSKQFNEATTAADRQSAALTLLALKYKKLREEGRSLALGGAGGGDKGIGLTGLGGYAVGAAGDVRKIIKDLAQLPRTLSSSSQQLAEIDLLLDNSVAGSRAFNELAKAKITFLERQRQIQIQINRAQTQMPADPFGTKVPLLPAAGQTSGKFQIKTDQERAAVNAVLGKKLQIEKSITRENERQAKATRSAARERLNNIRKIRRKRQGKQLNDQLLGAGFPLLFGGGAGSIGGSLLGGALGAPFGATFGGQIFGSAVGQQVEQLITRAQDLGNAIRELDFSTLEDSGVRVSAQLKDQVESLTRLGELEQARALVSEEVNEAVGTVPGVLESATNITNMLGNEFKKLFNSVGALLQMLAAPFFAALAAIAAAVNELVKAVNLIISGIAYVIELAGRFGIKLIAGEESADRLNKHMENTGGQLDSLKEKAAEFAEILNSIRINLNTDILKLDQQLKFARRRKVGDSPDVTRSNLALDREIAEAAAKQELIDSRAKIRKEGGVVTPEVQRQLEARRDLKFDLAEVKEKQGLERLNIRLSKQAANAAAKAARENAKSTKERQKQIEQATTLEREFSRELKNRQAVSQLDIDRNNINAEYEDRLARIEKIGDNTLTADAKRLALQIKTLKTAEAEANARVRSLKAANSLASSAGQFQLQLATIRANNPGQFRGVFGNSQKQAYLGGLEMQLELDERQRAIDAIREEAKTNPALTKEAENLEKSRDQYKFYQTQVLEATIAQQKFNDALAVTQPVTDSLFDSLMAVAEGTKTAEQAFADFLRSIADMLAQAAKQMIAQYIAIGIARRFAIPGSYSMSGGGMPFGGSGAAPAGLNTSPMTGFFNSGAFSPRANGGSVSGNRPYLVGERGPELFVPGAQGNIVSNDAMGSTSVVVNVDASGTEVQGNQGNADQLGRLIGQAVQAELIKQKRPGGLLTR